MGQHLIDLDDVAFAAAVAYFSEPGDDRVITSLKDAKELRERAGIEGPDAPADALGADRTRATG